jgi:hypothetical protein
MSKDLKDRDMFGRFWFRCMGGAHCPTTHPPLLPGSMPMWTRLVAYNSSITQSTCLQPSSPSTCNLCGVVPRFPNGESGADVYDRITQFEDHLTRDMLMVSQSTVCTSRLTEGVCRLVRLSYG